MKSINSYLEFNGNTETAFNFYKSVFGGEFIAVMRYSDIPEKTPDTRVTEEEKNLIMHIALPMGSNMIMGTDVPKSMNEATFGSNHSICIDAESRDEANRFFNGLSQGGTVTMPMDDMFWGDYFGSLRDKFGVQWMISFNTNNQAK